VPAAGLCQSLRRARERFERSLTGMRRAVTEDERPTRAEKDPDDWVTGEERMTGPQASYLKTLSQEAGEPFDEDEPLTKAEASRRIEELQRRTGRGESEGGA
jgi:hypothetical protein